ncbi:MAG: hypothetical protein WA941_20225 [Nitrososphaeraceae archaeon]
MKITHSDEDFRRIYYEYFSRLFNHVRKITFRGKQVNCLTYLVQHPLSSAYDIRPGRKPNDSSYTWAKITLKRLHKLGLIKVIKSEQMDDKEKHGSIRYSLTDEGILYLIRNTKLPYTMLLQKLFKNYHNSNIFRFLVYPYIKLETICSSKMKHNLMADVGSFLVSILQKMDHILDLLEKEERSDKERYFWNYEKLEGYLRKRYHFDYLDLQYTEEGFDDDHEMIRYFDNENQSRDVKVSFNKKSKNGYVYVRNNGVKRYKIPYVAAYLKKKMITHDEYVANHFEAFCRPRTEEFILLIFSEYPIDTTDDEIREILSADKPFIEALKEVKNSIDRAYRSIISHPNFVF